METTLPLPLVTGILCAANEMNRAASGVQTSLALEGMERKVEELIQALRTKGMLTADEAGAAYLEYFTDDDSVMWIEIDGVERIVIDIESGAAKREEC